MLTKQEINKTANALFNGRTDTDTWNALRFVCDQAKTAIDLAAENARLKAKLEEIKDKAWATGLHSDHDIYANAITEIYQTCNDGGDNT